MNNIKRAFLLIFLTVLTKQGIADSQIWRPIYSNHLHDAFLYEKFENITTHSLDVWVLINLKPETKLTDGSRSILTKRRYDCLNKKYSIYLFKSYSEYFGKGKLIAERVDQIVWKTYAPGSDAEHIISIACKDNSQN
jgi:hypothetical protein